MVNKNMINYVHVFSAYSQIYRVRDFYLSLVLFAHAIVNPYTVVVKAGHTGVAYAAMF